MFGLFKKKNRSQKNDGVRAALAGYGDDGTAVRHVIHFAYPMKKSTGSADDAVGVISEHFTPKTAEPTGVDGGLRFEHYREVASGDFDQLTDQLEADLAEIGWDYDGWECAVEAGDRE
ncbi:MAG: hypothetical protein HKN98_05130 [Silicimonas sp.]|nr:hypothetical protein [Silicimonas sp.]RZW12421.1 MAG: hypothetical protein EX266_01480 [Paracoccaceae bacterium]